MPNLNYRTKEDLRYSINYLMNCCTNDTTVDEFYKECLKKLNGIDRFSVGIKSVLDREEEDYGIFRVRECKNKTPFLKVDDLWEPPAEITKIGRCNDVSAPMFYCSNHLGTALVETGATKGSYWCIGDFFTFSDELECILMGLKEKAFLRQASKDYDYNSSPDKKEIVSKYLYKIFRRNGKKKKNVYIQTAGITKFVLNPDFAKNVDGVIYPSVASGYNGINIAILPENARRKIRLQRVFFIQIENINKNQVKYRVLSSGEIEGENIKWNNTKREMEQLT